MKNCTKTVSGKHLYEDFGINNGSHKGYHALKCQGCNLVDDTFDFTKCTEDNCHFISRETTNKRNDDTSNAADERLRQMSPLRRWFEELGHGD